MLVLPAAKLVSVPLLRSPESLRLKRWFSWLGEHTSFAVGSGEQAAAYNMAAKVLKYLLRGFLTVVNLFLSTPLFYKRACKLSCARSLGPVGAHSGIYSAHVQRRSVILGHRRVL